jgi:nucleotide-binding universal stress UspA family protein
MIKKIFVPLLTYPDAHSESVAENVSAIASNFSASINLLIQGVTFPQISNALGDLVTDVPGLVRAAKARSASHRKALEGAFAKAAANQRVEVTVTTLETYPTLFPEAAAREAHYSDLSILNVRPGITGMSQLAEAVIFGSGRPALLLPEGTSMGSARDLVIAWDGSAKSARALHDAEPFLAKADNVVVLTVEDDKPIDGAEIGNKLSRYLAAHGCRPSCQTIKSAGRPIAECLQDYSIGRGANLLVMGAFGHSRVRDFILGGATKGVLENSRFPTLLSH